MSDVLDQLSNTETMGLREFYDLSFLSILGKQNLNGLSKNMEC